MNFPPANTPIEPRARLSTSHRRIHGLQDAPSLRCFYCDTADLICACIDPWSTNGPTGATVDHIVPTTRGGGSKQDNLVIACRRCNSTKGDRIWPTEWFPGHETNTRVSPARIEPIEGDSLATLGMIYVLANLPGGVLEGPVGLNHIDRLIGLETLALAMGIEATSIRGRLEHLAAQRRLTRHVIPTGASAADYVHLYAHHDAAEVAA